MISNHEIISERRSQVYTLGSSSKPPLLLFHGYAQNGKDFLKEFDYLSEKYFLVSIEGISKFYTKGLFGNVGNSWMTTYNREAEISDYISLIDSVIEQFSFNSKLLLLGFSQGSQTAARWAINNPDKVGKILMCGGMFPKDMDPSNILDITHFIVGTDDPFVPKKVISKLRKLCMHFHSFEGNHEINHTLVKQLLE